MVDEIVGIAATLDNGWYVLPFYEGGSIRVPAERLSMRKIKEILRLRFELGLGNRQIARSCLIKHSTVADYLRRAVAASLDRWPLPAELDETELEKRLFPPRTALDLWVANSKSAVNSFPFSI